MTIALDMRRRTPRYTRTYQSRRRRQNRWIPFVLFLAVTGFCLWVVFQVIALLFSNVTSENAVVKLELLRGKAEFSLPESTQWSPGASEQTFLEGDSLRTGKNTKIALHFMEHNTLFLKESSEIKILSLQEKSSGKRTATFQLIEGGVWGYVDQRSFGGSKKSLFQIQTPSATLASHQVSFDLSTSDQQDHIRIIKGEAEIQVAEAEPLNMGVGQSLVINEESLNQIKQGQGVIDIVDNQFLESEWNIENLSIFFPQEARVLETQVKAKQVEVTPEVVSLPVSSFPSPRITSHNNNDRLTYKQVVDAEGKQVIALEGSVPEFTRQVQVGNYTLTRFQPGDRKWTYIASVEFGTLKPGENVFEIRAISLDGEASAPTKLTLFYEGNPDPTLPRGTLLDSLTPKDSAAPTDIKPFGAPSVTRPEIFALSPQSTYETSAAIVTFSGTVELGTKFIEVNGFRLRKFTEGETRFSYIANANYGNMEEGENIYKIRAFGPNEAISETQIKIYYQPLNIEV